MPYHQVGAPQFPNGTTNGAAWYPLTGGMQDYNYIWHGCMEVTLELSCCKYPVADELPQFWDDNRASLLQFLGEAHRGVKGFVKDENAIPIEGAAMKVLNIEKNIYPTLKRFISKSQFSTHLFSLRNFY